MGFIRNRDATEPNGASSGHSRPLQGSAGRRVTRHLASVTRRDLEIRPRDGIEIVALVGGSLEEGLGKIPGGMERERSERFNGISHNLGDLPSFLPSCTYGLGHV